MKKLYKILLTISIIFAMFMIVEILGNILGDPLDTILDWYLEKVLAVFFFYLIWKGISKSRKKKKGSKDK